MKKLLPILLAGAAVAAYFLLRNTGPKITDVTIGGDAFKVVRADPIQIASV